MEQGPKIRTRRQIVQSIASPSPRRPSAPPARQSAYRRQHGWGLPTRAQLASAAVREYQSRRLHPAVGPLPVAVAAGFAGAVGLLLAGADVFLVVAAAPVICLLAFGLVRVLVGGLAHRKVRSELSLAAAFDALVASCLEELPESSVERLRRIKNRVVPLLAGTGAGSGDPVLSYDDASFVRQSIARYIPDAVSPYLALSAEKRRAEDAEGNSPARILDAQLDMIVQKLDGIAAAADAAHLERMHRNRTFLDRKTR